MIKEIKQIINSNFTVVVEELQSLIEQGYKVIFEGESRPYHMVMGSFIVTVEKMVEEPEVVNPDQLELPLDSPVVFEPITTEKSEGAVEAVEAVEAPVPVASKPSRTKK